MTERTNNKDQRWVKCPPGAIQKVADSAMVDLAKKPVVDHQRRTMLTAAATAAGLVVIGGAGYLATRKSPQNSGGAPGAAVPFAGYDLGGIKCGELAVILHDYIAGAIEDQEQLGKVEKHLQLCEKCRRIYESRLNTLNS